MPERPPLRVVRRPRPWAVNQCADKPVPVPWGKARCRGCNRKAARRARLGLPEHPAHPALLANLCRLVLKAVRKRRLCLVNHCAGTQARAPWDKVPCRGHSNRVLQVSPALLANLCKPALKAVRKRRLWPDSQCAARLARARRARRGSRCRPARKVVLKRPLWRAIR